MGRIRIEGFEQDELQRSGLMNNEMSVQAFSESLEFEAQYRPTTNRNTNTVTDPVAIEEDRVTQLIFEDGSELLITAIELRRLLSAPEYIAERDLKQVLFKCINVFRIKDDVVSMTADALLKTLESNFEKTMGNRREGLYKLGFLPETLHKNETEYVFTGDEGGLTDEGRLIFALSAAAVGEDDIIQDIKQYPDFVAGKATHNSPILLLIHGTFSSTQGSFGGLGLSENRRVLKSLRKRYKRRIYSLQHRSLSNSPVKNAINAVNALPDEANLHLITHSRGGLVGELIAMGCHAELNNEPINLKHATEIYTRYGQCRGQVSAASLELEELKQLNELLKAKRISVSSFVRCACPIRGTSLLKEGDEFSLGEPDGGVRALASAMGHSLRLAIKMVNQRSVLGHVLDFSLSVLAASIVKLKDISMAPGLAAMSPTSPLIRLINSDERPLNSPLSVIAGDAKSGLSAGFAQNAGRVLTYLFFRQDNDFVVDTAFMFGGAMRTQHKAWYALEESANVNHFTYFSRSGSVSRVLEALALPRHLHEKNDVYNARSIGDFQKIPRSCVANIQTTVRQVDNLNGPVVFLLPGIMGSYLKADEELIWLHYWRLLRGQLTRLNIGQHNVRPSGLHVGSYQRFASHLRRDNEVIEFPFDWRLEIEQASKRLADVMLEKFKALEQESVQTGKPIRPIRIMAHSMGGLVARALMFVAPNVWAKLVNQAQFRFVMLGTPNNGAHTILRAYTGHNPIVRKVALLDVFNGLKDITQLISTFPGLANMIPYSKDSNWFDRGTWEQIKKDSEHRETCFSLPSEQTLKQAEDFYKQLHQYPLDRPELKHKVIYVAGQAARTATGLFVNTQGEIEFTATNEGDGSVTWASGIPSGVPTWYADVEHGKMAADEANFEAFSQLLSTGTTDLIKQEKSMIRSTLSVPNITMHDQPINVPMQDSMDDFLFEAIEQSRLLAIEPVRRIALKVRHGDLKFINGDVMVGHYIGDSILGAESALDDCLAYALSQSRELGVYPGVQLSSKYFNAPNKKTNITGALIIGLGRVGDLTHGSLKASLTSAIVQYLEAKQLANAGPLVRLTSLLIGSGLGGVSIRASIDAILEAVVAANALMENAARKTNRTAIFITELELIELYRDTALECLHVLNQAKETSSEVGRVFDVDFTLIEGAGGMARSFRDDAKDWWRRLDIGQNESDGSLQYRLLGDTAGAFIINRKPPNKFLDVVIDNIESSTYWNKKTASTLFEALLPKELKDYAFDEQNLLLVTDQATSKYPWELMEDRLHPNKIPLGVRVGLIRQLVSEHNEFGANYLNRDDIIIIGDPQLDTAANFRQLAGARLEAETVASLFEKNGYKVHASIGQPFNEVMETFLTNDCKVMHLAGHGIYSVRTAPDGKEQIQAGMVLSDGQYIDADRIRDLRFTPELVFINCCHLGKLPMREGEQSTQFSHIGSRVNEMAASLSRALIQMGVKIVVAAGWAVNDRAATVFAQAFYTELLVKGGAFGDAVIAARTQTHADYPNSNTWGAYQCYGDPSYKLISNSGRSKQNEATLFSVDEAILKLENIVSRAKADGYRTNDALRNNIDRIVDAATEKGWGHRPDLLAAAGLALAEVHEYKQAIDTLEKAMSIEQYSLSHKVGDELAGLKVLYALQLINNAHPERAKQDVALGSSALAPVESSLKSAKRLTDDAIAYLENERKQRDKDHHLLSRLGSAYKRKALMCDGQARKSALKKMRELFAEASRAYAYSCLITQPNNTEDAVSAYRQIVDTPLHLIELKRYPMMQYLQASLLYYWCYLEPKPKSKLVEVDIEALGQLVVELEAHIKAEAAKGSLNDFWAHIALNDIELVRLLMPDDELIRPLNSKVLSKPTYFKKVGSARQFASVLDTLHFLETILRKSGGNHKKPGADAVLRSIESVRTTLESQLN